MSQPSIDTAARRLIEVLCSEQMAKGGETAVDDAISELRAALAVPPAPPTGWQPISTCDERVDVIAFFPDACEEYQLMIVHRLGSDWYAQDADNCPAPFDDLDAPTHWLPLPPAPLAANGDR